MFLYRRRRRHTVYSIAPESQSLAYDSIRVEGAGWWSLEVECCPSLLRSNVDGKNNEKYDDTELPAFLAMLSGDKMAAKTLPPPYGYTQSIDAPLRHRKWW